MSNFFRFNVADQVFEALPESCFGIIAIRGAGNTEAIPAISDFLNEQIALQEEKLAGVNVKELPAIACYRQAFIQLGVNPNKFMCSIEALLSRIAKKKGFPSINPLVDLANAISIKYALPIGAHDLSTIEGELSVRFAEPGDTFVAFGSTEVETPEEKELLYVAGHDIRTRRWIWRQSEVGKITADTTDVFFPIDGFTNINKEQVLAARDELSLLLARYFDLQPVLGFVDRTNPEFCF
ncbi:MAG: phenylalanine--tRNA ligase beta subunit-related protein [Clostridiales bacterium]